MCPMTINEEKIYILKKEKKISMHYVTQIVNSGKLTEIIHTADNFKVLNNHF